MKTETAKKSRYSHEIQFGKIVYDAIKVSDSHYKLFLNRSDQGDLKDLGTLTGGWKRNYGVSNLSEQVKPYNQVIIISSADAENRNAASVYVWADSFRVTLGKKISYKRRLAELKTWDDSNGNENERQNKIAALQLLIDE